MPPETPTYPPDSPYRSLARALDDLPNRFPPTEDGSEVHLLAYFFTPEEAALAAGLPAAPETPASLAARLKREPREVTALLMGMAKKGLISPGRTAEGRPGFALKPFVYGFYEEYQGPMTEDLAQRFDAYFHASFARLLTFQPQIHRVLPVGEVVHKELAVRPYETVDALLERMQSFAVVPCICRTQRKMAGDPCGHPIDVCMVVNPQANVFTSGGHLRALTRDEARDTLRFAADSGLVHSVSNTRQDGFYICNCCTCGCGLLRGVAELGIAGVMASSAFISVVAEALCGGCETCVSACQFEAIRVDGIARVNGLRCAGCGLCVRVCPNEALSLSRREQEVIPPLDEREWGEARQRSR